MCFFIQAEDGIRGLVRSRGLGDVYMRQEEDEKGRQLLVVTELPYMVNPDTLALRIAELVNLSLIHI